MYALVICICACLAAYTQAGILGYVHDQLPVVGASGIVTSGGAVGPAGVVTGHGAVGPDGIVNTLGYHAVHIADGEDDGQWHGEGLAESQDLDAHHGEVVVAPAPAVVVPPAAAVVARGVHGVGLHGHGAVVAGPSGTIVADAAHGHILHGFHGYW